MNCVAAASRVAVRREDQLQQAAAEGRAVDALAGRREQHLLDQVADVLVVVRVRRCGRGCRNGMESRSASRRRSRAFASRAIDQRRAGRRRRCAWLSAPAPAARRRALASRRRPTAPSRTGRCRRAATNGQPATTYGVRACVTTGCPLTSTRGMGAVGCAWPPCAHITVAPT